MDQKWLRWAKSLQAIAQTGLTYTQDLFDIERYQAIQEIALEMLAEQTGAPLQDVRAFFLDEVGHATPKIDVRGVVFQNDGILLVREKGDGGLWTLPGGWADINESPSEATEREVLEESGYRTRAVKLLALYDRNKHDHPPHAFHIYKLLFLCELIGGQPTSSIETDGAAFFKEDAIPALSLSRTLPEQISQMFIHHRHPDRPTDFD
jgi:ADP-ribose pyrophosphatase YjhB (NUDIX family)